MTLTSLSSEHDPMGAALVDYHRNGRAKRLRVFSSLFDEDELPVATLFRSVDAMPVIERKALELCGSTVLDVGGGSGCHALALQSLGKVVTSIDISPGAVEVMKARGVRDARLCSLFDERLTDSFDTVLMLMNGSGIIGRLEHLPSFFRCMDRLLRPGGRILMDSSDLLYLFEEEDGSMLVDLAGDYYGEVDFRMQYGSVMGASFDWLYIDFQTLSYYATACGYRARLLHEGKHYDYLAELTKETI